MALRPTIVVSAHARPAATIRLLDSILRADVAEGTALVISIDQRHGDPNGRAVQRIAAEFDWPVGPKQVAVHAGIGLVNHFHACGDLTHEHDAVVLLEDDLLVGPGFHRWASAALEHGDGDTQIAGISLATPWFDGFRQLRFEPVDDGTDALFAQVPWYDGMAWTRRMWADYRQAQADGSATTARPLHASFSQLGADEWFPDMIRYLVATDRWWLLPRTAHATGTGAAGAHFGQGTDWFQSELAVAAPAAFRLAGLCDSASVYDDHMEPTPATVRRVAPDLQAGAMVVDLLGSRDLTAADPDALVLTTRPVEQAEATWGAAMHPLVMNLRFDQPGDAIRLALRRHVHIDASADDAALATLRAHHNRGRTTGRRDALRTLAPRAFELANRLRRDR